MKKKQYSDFKYLSLLLENNNQKKDKVTVKDLLVMRRKLMESNSNDVCKILGHDYEKWNHLFWNNTNTNNGIILPDNYDCWARNCRRCGVEQVSKSDPTKVKVKIK